MDESRSRKRFKDLDAFPKVEEGYQERSSAGGAVTAVLAVVLLVLVVSELVLYRGAEVNYQYSVDHAATGSLQINLDISIAMGCEGITVDMMDAAHVTTNVRPFIRMTPTTFSVESTPPRSEQDVFYLRSLIKNAKKEQSKSKVVSTDTPVTGCRLSGSFQTNKVHGTLHILGAGHGGHHHGGHLPHNAMNFTHRIDRLSFGEEFPGIVNPLDGTVNHAETNFDMFQYFISLVPTVYQDARSNVIYTNQFAVTEHARTVDHARGSHGVPGILFKYNIESIMVSITEDRNSFLHFVTRICGIVGGIYVTTGIIHRLSQAAVERVRTALR